MKRKAFSLFAVALLLVSTVAGFGLVAAQGTVYQKTFTGAPDNVVVDQSDMSGQFEVSVMTGGVPNTDGQTLLARTTVGSGTEQKIVFNSDGVYQNVTVQVRPADGTTGEPSFHTGDGIGLDVPYIIGDAGSDADMICDTTEKLYQMANPQITVVDCNAPADYTINTTGTDAAQVELDTYQSAINQKAAADTTLTPIENRLRSVEVPYLKGYKASVEAMNSGMPKSGTKVAAKGNVSDYFSTIQVNTIAEWNRQVENIKYLRGVLSNESGTSTQFLDVPIESSNGNTGSVNYVDIVGFGSTSVTLQNGSTTTAKTITVEMEYDDGNVHTEQHTFGPTTGEKLSVGYDGTGYSSAKVDLKRVRVKGTSNTDPKTVLDFQRFADVFNQVDSRASTVNAEMDTIVNNTYSEYQSGDLNTSEMWIPGMSIAGSPDSHQSFAASVLASYGASGPGALDSTGYFNITTESGASMQGVLMSDSNPPSGKFAVNQTYDPSNITGVQWFVTDSATKELTENFTVDAIRSTGGESMSNVTMDQRQYRSVNNSQMLALFQSLQKDRAEIETRDQKLKQASIIGGMLPGVGGLLDLSLKGKLMVAAAAVLVGLLLVARVYLKVTTLGRV